MDNVNLPEYMYTPFPSVPHSPLYTTNRGSVGQYYQNANQRFQEHPSKGGTFQGPAEGNATE